MSDVKLYSCSFHSPIGYINCIASDLGLRECKVVQSFDSSLSMDWHHQILNDTKMQLEEYFEGKRKSFKIPFDYGKATKFYKSVWKILLAIPYGSTRSYGEIATQLGDIQKSRAVGMANGKNPIAIIVPCHRVIGSDHSLTGYAYGIEKKLWLLNLENPDKWPTQTALFK